MIHFALASIVAVQVTAILRECSNRETGALLTPPRLVTVLPIRLMKNAPQRLTATSLMTSTATPATARPRYCVSTSCKDGAHTRARRYMDERAGGFPRR